jgi:hypothetical protein
MTRFPRRSFATAWREPGILLCNKIIYSTRGASSKLQAGAAAFDVLKLLMLARVSSNLAIARVSDRADPRMEEGCAW